MKYSVMSRALNHELVNKSHSLLTSLDCPKICRFNTSGFGYVAEMFKNNYGSDWIINIDEDAFVFDIDRMLNLLDYMELEGYTICGVPDGGVIHTRVHNPIVPNPFFNIINHKFTSSINYNHPVIFNNVLKSRTPYHLFKLNCDFEFDEYEDFYPLFYNMIYNGARILYLDVDEYGEVYKGNARACIVKDHLGVPFLIHSWYGRDYGESPDRINGIFDYAKQHQIIKD